MRKITLEKALRFISLLVFISCIGLSIWGYQQGIFTSQSRISAMISSIGIGGLIFFTIIQIVQVVIPIIPGGVSCLAGVLLFGAWTGFLCNYIGICLGSLIAFALSKSYGRPLLKRIFGSKLIARYDGWTKNKEKFDKLFALAIFLPVASDDFLCYLAGTTAMSYRRFICIILLGKPLAIATYSLPLNSLLLKFF